MKAPRNSLTARSLEADASPENSRNMLFWLYAPVFAAIVMFFAALLVAGPHLHDFADWVFQGKVLALKLTAPDSVIRYQLAPYPVPNSLAVFLLAALNLITTPVVAGKIFLMLMLLLWCSAALLFCRRWLSSGIGQANGWVLIVCLGGFSSFFWYGYSSYQLGIAIFILFLARYKATTSPLEVSLFGVALFFSHAMSFLSFGLLTLIVVFFCRFPFRHLIAMTPAVLLSLAFLVGRHHQQFDPPVSGAAWAGLLEMAVYKVGTVTMLGPFRNFLLPDGSSLLEGQPVLYWLGVACNVSVVFIIGLALLCAFYTGFCALRNAALNRNLDLRSGLLLYSMLLGVLWLVAPHGFFGMENPGVRIALPMLFTALPSFTFLSAPTMRWLSIGIAVVSLITSAAYFANVRKAEVENIGLQATSQPPPQTRGSVLAYNNWLYRNTRYKYYNYRIHALAERLKKAQEEPLQGLAFKTGPIIAYHPKG